MRFRDVLWVATGIFAFARIIVPVHAAPAATNRFEYKAVRFADIQVLRYQVPGFENLTIQQKKLAYYLYEAGLCGRGIIWDQKYRNKLAYRKTIETILTSYRGARTGTYRDGFVTYAKQVCFAKGIHLHYGSAKMIPEFPPQ